MTILAIETSCDETAAAVLRNGVMRANIIYSQTEHLKYGGVVPELASRAHIAKIHSVVQEALVKSDTMLGDIDLVAATCGPGLIGSLHVGLTFAKGLALARSLPLLGINHLEGHLYSATIEYPQLQPPFLCLIVSGGHTILANVLDYGECKILGQTQDDAAGEAFDKVAKILGLPYPGGPALERTAATGDPHYVDFPVAQLRQAPFDFSFSGLKTAVLYHAQALSEQERQRRLPDIAASFQRAVTRALSKSLVAAMEATGETSVALVGGVAQNNTLRQHLQSLVEAGAGTFFAPSAEYCADNAGMIAQAAYLLAGKRPPSPLSLSAVPNLPLATINADGEPSPVLQS